MFGIAPHPDARAAQLRRAGDAAAEAFARALPARGVGLISGPSGAGKSTVLRRLAAQAHRRGTPVFAVTPAFALATERRPPLDLLHGSFTDDIRLLCASGLAEAPLWLRPTRALSEGQRARLALALAIAAARDRRATHAWLIADEFASSLDRASAMALALGWRRIVAAAPGCALAVASAHDDIERWLAPAVTLRLDPGFAHNARFTLRTPMDRA
jgi:ABC-type ATPase with predicted acetyltransferase domain